MKFPIAAEDLNILAAWIDLQDARHAVDINDERQTEVQQDVRRLARRLGQLEQLPEVVCLVGSTRFHEQYKEQNLRLTLEGRIVLTIGVNAHDDDTFANMDPLDVVLIKEGLDRLHLRKIDLADRVFCINVGGYVGESTSNELRYATISGKPIDYLEEVPNGVWRRLDPTTPEGQREIGEALKVGFLP